MKLNPENKLENAPKPIKQSNTFRLKPARNCRKTEDDVEWTRLENRVEDTEKKWKSPINYFESKRFLSSTGVFFSIQQIDGGGLIQK